MNGQYTQIFKFEPVVVPGIGAIIKQTLQLYINSKDELNVTKCKIEFTKYITKQKQLIYIFILKKNMRKKL